jgi:hypothetical protein
VVNPHECVLGIRRIILKSQIRIEERCGKRRKGKERKEGERSGNTNQGRMGE